MVVQARHSYTCDEIEWDKSFVGCVSRDPLDGCTTIDFSRFHDLQVGDKCPHYTHGVFLSVFLSPYPILVFSPQTYANCFFYF
jgi:hypothetical protein